MLGVPGAIDETGLEFRLVEDSGDRLLNFFGYCCRSSRWR